MTSQSTTGRANQKLRTRAAIVKAAAELIRTGREVTMPEVAEAVLVSEATAYRYFPDLVSLLREAIAGQLPTAAEALAPVPSRRTPPGGEMFRPRLPAQTARAGRVLHEPVDRRHGRDRRQCRAPGRRPRPERPGQRPAMDHRRLHPGGSRLPDAHRIHRGPDRAAPGVPGRAGAGRRGWADDGGRCDADRGRPDHGPSGPAGRLCGVRGRIRPGQRPDQEHGRLRHATCAGRRIRGDLLDGAPDRQLPRGWPSSARSSPRTVRPAAG
jgi:AcrR family transcriptional regulator